MVLYRCYGTDGHTPMGILLGHDRRHPLLFVRSILRLVNVTSEV
jgi:hypothetical protein